MSFCPTGWLELDAASLVASLNLRCRTSSIACFVAARSRDSCGADLGTASSRLVPWKWDSRSDRTLRALRFRRRSLFLMLSFWPCSGAAERPCLVWKTRQRCRGDHRRSEQPHQCAPTQRALGVRVRTWVRAATPPQSAADARKVKWSRPSPLDSPLAARCECSTTKALFLVLFRRYANHFDLRTFKFGYQLALAAQPTIRGTALP